MDRERRLKKEEGEEERRVRGGLVRETVRCKMIYYSKENGDIL